MSGGSSRPHRSCAQNVPVLPPPVWTSSTMNATPRLDATSRSLRKKSWDAWLSPPSAWMGSTMTAATSGLSGDAWLSAIARSARSRHLASSSAFSAACPSRGYVVLGKSTEGQSNAGMSTLCIALLCVADIHPRRRPWNAPLNDRTARSGVPGARFAMQLSISSGLGGRPPRFLVWYQMNAALKAFSFEQLPHIIVWASVRPGGAKRMRVDSIRPGQSSGGSMPRHGRWRRRGRLAGSVMAACMAGWLYPMGREAIWPRTSRYRLPSTSTR
mmetsp:Transcript_25415/g.57324  ORF Transcript_25415/g.57324 Transcript_25415/m.57324 type:complete len:271 (+) Transcript_25415:645-1457(+)